jgi:hypothetical protein
MGVVRTHTFRLGTYHIEQADGIDGCCDTPPWDYHEMIIKEGDDFNALDTALKLKKVGITDITKARSIRHLGLDHVGIRAIVEGE